MRTNKINNLVYETIVFITGLPYDLESGKDSDQIKDAILKRFETIWSAAGHTHCVFAATYKQLKEMTNATESDEIT